MLKINDSIESINNDIFSENNITKTQNFDDLLSPSVRLIRLEEDNSQLKKEVSELKLELSKKVEFYESKLIKLKYLNSNNEKYQQKILDLQKRIEISAQQNLDQKNQYKNDIQKMRDEFENQISILNEKAEYLQKKCSKSEQILNSRELEKSNLDQQFHVQSNKVINLLQTASNYFNFYFSSIDSFLSFLTSNKNPICDSEQVLEKEKAKIKKLQNKCRLINQEKSKYLNQIQTLKNQNQNLNNEISSLKANHEIELNKIKLNQISPPFNNQQNDATRKRIEFFENQEEKNEEIHNLQLIIAKQKSIICQLHQKNKFLKQSLQMKNDELNSLKNNHSNIEDKFNEIESFLSKQTKSQVKIMKLKRKIIDLSSTIDNLRSEIVTLQYNHREELLKNEIQLKKLKEELQSNLHSKSSSYSNSFNEDNKMNETVLDASYCIDESVPREIVDSLKEILENKGLKINLKIRLITKSLSTYFGNLSKNKFGLSNENEEAIVHSFIEKVYNLILKQFISYQNFIDNKVVRKALIERAKELVSIAESQSNLNNELHSSSSSSEKRKKISKKLSQMNYSKSGSNSNKYSISIKSSDSSMIDILSPSSDDQPIKKVDKKSNKNRTKTGYSISQNSELNTITHIESLSQSQLASKAKRSLVEMYEEEEEENESEDVEQTKRKVESRSGEIKFDNKNDEASVMEEDFNEENLNASKSKQNSNVNKSKENSNIHKTNESPNLNKSNVKSNRSESDVNINESKTNENQNINKTNENQNQNKSIETPNGSKVNSKGKSSDSSNEPKSNISSVKKSSEISIKNKSVENSATIKNKRNSSANNNSEDFIGDESSEDSIKNVLSGNLCNSKSNENPNLTNNALSVKKSSKISIKNESIENSNTVKNDRNANVINNNEIYSGDESSDDSIMKKLKGNQSSVKSNKKVIKNSNDSDEGIISGIESLVDDLKLQID